MRAHGPPRDPPKGFTNDTGVTKGPNPTDGEGRTSTVSIIAASVSLPAPRGGH